MACVLIVDDLADPRHTIAGILEDAGHSTVLASNESQAIRAFAEHRVDFAVIDMRLHGSDDDDETGLNLAAAIRSFNKEVRLVLFTRHRPNANQVVRAVKLSGALDFLEKWGEDFAEQLLGIIENPGPLPVSPDDSRLTISLGQTGQPIHMRCSGKYRRVGFTDSSLTLAVDRYAQRVQDAHRIDGQIRFQAEDIGSSIWQDLFGKHALVYDIYSSARGASRHLSIVFEGSEGMLRLPVEFLRIDERTRPFVLQHPISRYVSYVSTRRPTISPTWLAEIECLRVLLIASNTHTRMLLPDIPGVDTEVGRIGQFLLMQNSIPVDVKILMTKDATYERVIKELENSPYHIIHYAGHGSFSAESPEASAMYFWERQNHGGSVIPLQATLLSGLLQESDTRFVYLSSCSGMRTASDSALIGNDLLGLAVAVVRAGVPSVLGYRWPVRDDAASTLPELFYGGIVELGNPELALWRARQRIYSVDPNDVTWLSPILIHQD